MYECHFFLLFYSGNITRYNLTHYDAIFNKTHVTLINSISESMLLQYKRMCTVMCTCMGNGQQYKRMCTVMCTCMGNGQQYKGMCTVMCMCMGNGQQYKGMCTVMCMCMGNGQIRHDFICSTKPQAMRTTRTKKLYFECVSAL